MILTVMTAGILIILTATASFSQLSDIDQENLKNQRIEETVITPEREEKNKKPAYQPRKRANRPRPGKSVPHSRRHKVAGYLGQTFVFGEVIQLKNGKLEGYIYHPKNSRTYVYGEQSKGKINLYDTNGQLYQVIRQ